MSEEISHYYEFSIYTIYKNSKQTEFYYNASHNTEKILHIFSKNYQYYKSITQWFSYNREALDNYMKNGDEKEYTIWKSWKHIDSIYDFTNFENFFTYFTLYMKKTFVWNDNTYPCIPFHIKLKKIKIEKTYETICSEAL